MSKLKPQKKDWTRVETHMAEIYLIFAGTSRIIKGPDVKKIIIKKDKAYSIKLIK